MDVLCYCFYTTLLLEVCLARIIQTDDINNEKEMDSEYSGTTPMMTVTLDDSKGPDARGPDDLCDLPMNPGPCLFYSTMFYYDNENDKCEKFEYGGCLGNGNKFYDYNECEDRCQKETPSPTVCSEPKDTGAKSCSSNYVQYFYNTTSNECEQLAYTGCSGKGNRFHDIDSCQYLCKIPDETCMLPPDSGVGPYNATFFYYDSTTDECLSFVYKGSFGNKNRFYDKEECEMECQEY